MEQAHTLLVTIGIALTAGIWAVYTQHRAMQKKKVPVRVRRK